MTDIGTGEKIGMEWRDDKGGMMKWNWVIVHGNV